MRKRIIIIGLILQIALVGCKTQIKETEINESSDDSVTSESITEDKTEITYDLDYKDWTDVANTIDLPKNTKLIKRYTGEALFGTFALHSYVDADDGWIYYQNPDENGYLYKIDQYSNNKTLLAKKAFSHSIRVIKDVIYFACSEAGNNGTTTQVYSINTDGTNLTKLFEGKGDDMLVTEDHIYYSSYPEPEFSLHRYNISSGEIEQLNNNFSESFSVVDDKLYYQSNIDYINVIDLIEKTDELFYSPGSALNYVQYNNNKIYYVKGADICKFNLNTKEESYLFKATENLSANKFIASEDYVFFTCYTYTKEREIISLWRMNLDGSDLIKLYDKENIGVFHIVGDKIFTYNKFFPNKDSKITVFDFNGNLINFDM